MKYCPNCGAELPDGARFCTGCGAAQAVEAPQQQAPVFTQPAYSEPAYTAAAFTEPAPAQTYAEPAPAPAAPQAKKTKKKASPAKIIIPIVIVLALVAAGVFLYMSGFFMNTPQRFVKMHETVVEPLVKAAAASATGNYDSIEQASAAKLNTDLTITAEVDGLPDVYADLIADSSIVIKTKLDKDESIIEVVGEIGDADAIEGTIVLTKEAVSFLIPALTDEYYTINFSDVREILEDALGMDLEEIGIPVDSYLDLATGKSGVVSMKQSEVETLLNKYLDIVFSVVTKENCVKGSGTVELYGLGKKMSCDVITFTPTSDDVANMIVTLCETAQKDKDLEKLITEAMTNVLVMSGECDEDDAEDYVDDMLETFNDALDNIIDNAEDYGDSVEDNGISVIVGYKGNEIYAYQIISEEQGEGVGYENYVSDSNHAQCLARYYDDCEESEVLFRNEYKVDGKNYKGEFVMYSGDEETLTLSYKLNTEKKSPLGLYYGSYTVEVEGDEIELTVKEAKKGVDHIITAEIEGIEVALTVNASDSSTAAKPKGKATKITADNYEDMLEELGEGLESLVEDLEDIF